MADYKWHPIEPLSDEDRAIDRSEITPLLEAWLETKDLLPGLPSFKERLLRSLSIETGILERLYDLNAGATETLILYGFSVGLLAETDTDIKPSLLIDILDDHQAAAQMMMDAVAKNRELSKGFIHELQAVLTRHQKTATAVDQFGNRLEVPLLRGKYKEQENNPTRPDGFKHGYCPPVQVDSEMENLLRWYGDYRSENPILRAAWLHHRFTQIHPYQDGNGRVARALAMLPLLSAGLLPVVVDRKTKKRYLEALEQADAGDLAPVVQLFGSLEKQTILQALNTEADESTKPSIAAEVIEHISDKRQRRLQEIADRNRQIRHERELELRNVNQVAVNLRTRSVALLQSHLQAIKDRGLATTEPLREGGPDRENAYYYRFQVAELAKEAGKWANFNEDHYFVQAALSSQNVRLKFVVSFHHTGHELTGIIEVTAFAELKFMSPEEGSPDSRFFACSLEPFPLTWKTQLPGIERAFDSWLDRAFAVALKTWSDHS